MNYNSCCLGYVEVVSERTHFFLRYTMAILHRNYYLCVIISLLSMVDCVHYMQDIVSELLKSFFVYGIFQSNLKKLLFVD